MACPRRIEANLPRSARRLTLATVAIRMSCLGSDQGQAGDRCAGRSWIGVVGRSTSRHARALSHRHPLVPSLAAQVRDREASEARLGSLLREETTRREEADDREARARKEADEQLAEAPPLHAAGGRQIRPRQAAPLTRYALFATKWKGTCTAVRSAM